MLTRSIIRLWFCGILFCPLFTGWAAELPENAKEPEIVRRAAWGAKSANTALMSEQTPAGIIIHHTSVLQKPGVPLEKKLINLQSFSQRPGIVEKKTKKAWGDVPYHYYIDASGRIGEGRDVKYAGDSNTSYDTSNKIQIVLEGNFETETPAEAQLASLRQLLNWLTDKYKIKTSDIHGHGEMAATDCPGIHLKPFIEDYKKLRPQAPR